MDRTTSSLDRAATADEIRWAAERRRILWGTVGIGLVVMIGLFGRLRWNYQTIRAADGQTYEILARGRELRLHETATVLRYRSNASRVESVEGEMRQVLPFAAMLARANGDSIIILDARHTVWEYGLASVGHTYHARFVRHGPMWVSPGT